MIYNILMTFIFALIVFSIFSCIGTIYNTFPLKLVTCVFLSFFHKQTGVSNDMRYD